VKFGVPVLRKIGTSKTMKAYMFKSFLALTLLITTSLVHAGEGGTVTGNGGDVIVCGDKVQMLDVYEGMTLRNLHLDLDGPDFKSKVDFAIRRIMKVDPWRGRVLWQLNSEFLSEVKFVRNVDLRDIEDSNQPFLPKGCKQEQIAIQNIKVTWADPTYIINEDLWDKLDENNKAVLVIHEIVFLASTRIDGVSQWTSPTVRFMTEIMISNFIFQESDVNYRAYVSTTPLAETVMAGEAKNFKWYSQSLDFNNPFHHDARFHKPDILELSTARETEIAQWRWSNSCQTMGGKQISPKDIPHVIDVINTFHPSSSSAFPFYVSEGKAKPLSLIRDAGTRGAGKVENPGRAETGALWCVFDKRPSWLNVD
jgi:hypothetical protein